MQQVSKDAINLWYLQTTDPYKSTGRDEIPPIIIKDVVDILIVPISALINKDCETDISSDQFNNLQSW